MDSNEVTRRKFLKQSGTAAVALGLGLGSPRLYAAVQGANERINVGIIGCGGMGSAHVGFLLHLREQGLVNIVGVCDVFTKRLDAAAARTGGKPYRDYRKLLEDKDVEAVLIATPDHWHSKITMDAAQAGKDVYCEKPMTYWGDLKEAQDVVKTIDHTKRVMQVGTQAMSGSIWAPCAERIQAGALGKLIHAQASDCRNFNGAPYAPTRIDPDAKPGETLDWDMWLGPAPKRPYDPGRFIAFRCYWDYSGGVGTDFFPHILTPMVRTMGLGFPKRVVASGGLYYHLNDSREIPDIFTLLIEYPGGPSVMLLGSLATDVNVPMLVRGQKATLTFEYKKGPVFGTTGAIIESPSPPTSPKKNPEEIQGTGELNVEAHWKDFLNCIKTRQKPRSNEVLGYHVMTALHMGIHSYRRGRAMEFDPSTEQVRAV